MQTIAAARSLRHNVRMRAKTNFTAQAGLNSTSLTTVAVAAAMSLGGAQAPQAVPFATEQRPARISKSGFGAAGALNPLPIGEIARATAGATAAMPHTVTWRTTPQDAAHPAIKDAGFYFTQGGPVVPEAERFRYQLHVDARNSGEALAKVRQVIRDAKGESLDLVVHKPDEARTQEMLKAFEAARASHSEPDPV
jgi:hypothetical protein